MLQITSKIWLRPLEIVVPTVEVSAVNDDAVVSAENIECVPSVSNDVCADGDVAVNLEPVVSANTLVSDVKTDDAVLVLIKSRKV